jgi:hypothetical protein
MTDAISSMESATVPRVGHAPTLDEPEAQKAIDTLLKRVVPQESPRRKPGPGNTG